MGFSSSKISLVKKSAPVDIQFRRVVSKNDQYFLNFETNANFFTNYSVEDLVFTILRYHPEKFNESLDEDYTNYNAEKGLTPKNCKHVNIMSEYMFDMFLEKRILKTSLIDQEAVYGNEHLKDLNQFKSFYGHYFISLYKSYKSYHNTFFKEKVKKGDDEFVPKLGLLPLAFYYGQGQMRAKIELFFNLLCNQNDTISLQDYNLRTLIFFLIASASTASLIALDKFATEDEETRKSFSENEYVRIYDFYQVKDCIRVMEEILAKLFDTTDLSVDKEISSEEFKWSFTKHGLYWLFYPSGVRNYLEVNSDE
jgi:hypothetical protein